MLQAAGRLSHGGCAPRAPLAGHVGMPDGRAPHRHRIMASPGRMALPRSTCHRTCGQPGGKRSWAQSVASPRVATQPPGFRKAQGYRSRLRISLLSSCQGQRGLPASSGDCVRRRPKSGLRIRRWSDAMDKPRRTWNLPAILQDRLLHLSAKKSNIPARVRAFTEAPSGTSSEAKTTVQSFASKSWVPSASPAGRTIIDLNGLVLPEAALSIWPQST